MPHPRTIFRGFAKLPPAHYGVYATASSTTHCYWHPDFNREVDRPLADYADELRELLDLGRADAAASDVPLGAFLSGGVDSSLIVGLMQQLSSEPVKTFSIGFPRPGVRRDGRTPARWPSGSAPSTTSFASSRDAVDVLAKLVWHYDEPFADSSAIPDVVRLAS